MTENSELSVGAIVDTAVANFGGAMEADTISKHGRSSKSQTSRGHFNACLLFVAILLTSFNLLGQELISKGKPVTASKTHPTTTPAGITDGTLATGWNAGASAPQTVQIDLQGNYDISSINLFPQLDRAGKLVQKIYMSEDLKNWKEIDNFTENNPISKKAIIRNYNNIPNIRGVRIETVSNPTWVSWLEIEIYGTISGGGNSNYGNSNQNSVNIYESIKKIDCYTKINPEIFTFSDKNLAFVKISEKVFKLVDTQDLQEKSTFNFKGKGSISLGNSYTEGNFIFLAIRTEKGEIKEYARYNLSNFSFQNIKCKNAPRGCIVSSASSSYVSLQNNAPYDFGNFKIFFRNVGFQYFYEISKIVVEKADFNNAMRGSQNEKLDFLKKYPNSEYKNAIITSFTNSFTRIKDISDFIKTNNEFNSQLDERAFALVNNSNSENELQEYISVFPNGKYVSDANKKIASIKQAKAAEEKRIVAERQAQQEQTRLAEQQRVEEQARLAEEKERDFEAKKNSVGRSIYWYETITFDTSGGGLGGLISSAIGLGSTSYRVRYTAIVEAVIGESAVKVIISRATIEDPGWASINYIKYKPYAIEEINKVIGQTRVKQFNEFNL